MSSPPTAQPVRLRFQIVLAGLIYLVDAFVLTMGLLAILTGIAGILLGMIGLVRGIFGDRSRIMPALATMGIYIGCGGAVMATLRLHNAVARHRAEGVITALHAYEAKYGTCPNDIQVLVPEFVAAIPHAKYTLLFNRFEFRKMPQSDDCSLAYTLLPPFGRAYYDVKKKSWSSLD